MLEFIKTFGSILGAVIFPIFVQICVGFVSQKIFRLDIRTLSAIQFYIFIPALMFVKIYQGTLDLAAVTDVFISTVVIYLCMAAIGFLTGFVFRFKSGMKSAFANSVSLYNSGNYCIPLMQLLYNNEPFVMSAQAIIMVVQNAITCTAGALVTGSGKGSFKAALKNALAIPVLYVVVPAAVLKGLHVTVWTPVINTLDIMGACLVPLALFTLGAQLAETKINFSDYRIFLSNFIKLIIAPAITLGVIYIMGLTGITAQVILIVSAAPTAVNVLILAMQYDNESDFVSKTVFSSTMLSSLTVTAVIYFALNFLK